jgi:hypothetical protein
VVQPEEAPGSLSQPPRLGPEFGAEDPVVGDVVPHVVEEVALAAVARSLPEGGKERAIEVEDGGGLDECSFRARCSRLRRVRNTPLRTARGTPSPCTPRTRHRRCVRDDSSISDARLTLFVVGSALDVIGIFLVMAPDLVPYRARLSEWLRASYRRMVERLRGLTDRLLRLLGRPRHKVINAEAGMYTTVGFDASAFVSVGEGASLERKVEYLLDRERRAQETFGTLERRLAEVESRRFEELRREVEGHVSEAIAEAEGRYRPLRVLGGLALVAGLVCLSVATFV